MASTSRLAPDATTATTQIPDPRFDLTQSEKEAAKALKAICDQEGIHYNDLFELAKYVLVVDSSYSDSDPKAPQKRLKKAVSLLKKRNAWQKSNQMETVKPMKALEDLYEVCPEFFVTKYTHDEEGRVVVGHHQAYAPADYMYKSKENLATFLAAEQFRFTLGAVDMVEARRGMCIVGVSHGTVSASRAYRYIKMATRSQDNFLGMHPHRIKRIWTEVPTLMMYAVRSIKAFLPRKISERIKVVSTMEDLEKYMKTSETIPTNNVLDWAKFRHAKYLETVNKLSF